MDSVLHAMHLHFILIRIIILTVVAMFALLIMIIIFWISTTCIRLILGKCCFSPVYLKTAWKYKKGSDLYHKYVNG